MRETDLPQQILLCVCVCELPSGVGIVVVESTPSHSSRKTHNHPPLASAECRVIKRPFSTPCSGCLFHPYCCFSPHEERKMTQKKGFTPWWGGGGGISIVFIRSLTFHGSFSANIHKEEKLHKDKFKKEKASMCCRVWKLRISVHTVP